MGTVTRRSHIPAEEIRNAKVVVEQAHTRSLPDSPKRTTGQANDSRVRFVLKGREIICDRSGFHIEATSDEAKRK